MKKTRRTAALLLMMMLLFTCAHAQEAAGLSWTELGEGPNEMSLLLVSAEGGVKGYRLHSARTTLLEGLLELGLAQTAETENGLVLTVVDGCALPEDDPAAYWFIAVFDAAQDAFIACREPLEQLPLAGQTYAMGMALTLGAMEE